MLPSIVSSPERESRSTSPLQSTMGSLQSRSDAAPQLRFDDEFPGSARASPFPKSHRASTAGVSWTNLGSPTNQNASLTTLPSISRPTSSRAQSITGAPRHHHVHHRNNSGTSFDGHLPKYSPGEHELGSARSSSTNVTTGTESPRYLGTVYQPKPQRASSPPSGDQLKIMRLVRMGQVTPSNPKLARLAAMMDQNKLRDVDYTQEAARAQRLLQPPSERTSATGSPNEQLPAAHLPPLVKSPNSESTSPSPSGSSPSVAFDHHYRTLSSAEDYWRGFAELEEAQRRYYLWTLFRRGVEESSSSRTSSAGGVLTSAFGIIGVHTSSSPHVVAAEVSRRLSQSLRPQSASHVAAPIVAQLPLRPSSGSVLRSHQAVLDVRSIPSHRVGGTPRSSSNFVAAIPPQALVLKDPPTALEQTTSNDDPITRSPICDQSMSPRTAVLNELSRRLADAQEDLVFDEQVHRSVIDDREHQLRMGCVVLPMLTKLTPMLEKYNRKHIEAQERELYFTMTSQTSRYLHAAQSVEGALELAKQAVFDAAVTHLYRMWNEQIHLAEEESQSRQAIAAEAAFSWKHLDRRWHQHFQIMLYRFGSYLNAHRLVYDTSRLYQSELSSRQVLCREEILAAKGLVEAREVIGAHIECATRHEQETAAAFQEVSQRAQKLHKRWMQLAQEISTSMQDEERQRTVIAHRQELQWSAFEDDITSVRAMSAKADAQVVSLSNIVRSHGEAVDEHFRREQHAVHQCIARIQMVINPERVERGSLLHEQDAEMSLINSVWCCHQNGQRWLHATVHLMEMEFSDSCRLLTSIAAVIDEEYRCRERILDLEDEAYGDDVMLVHQRMRRLDTVRSFIIASPTQERRSRLAVEAEYREGLYLLMELNDDVMNITRTAEAAMATKVHIVSVAFHAVQRDMKIIQPEISQREGIEQTERMIRESFYALCSSMLNREQQLAVWLREANHLKDIMLSMNTKILFSNTEIFDEENTVRRTIEKQEDSEVVVAAGIACQLAVASREFCQRRGIISCEAAQRVLTMHAQNIYTDATMHMQDMVVMMGEHFLLSSCLVQSQPKRDCLQIEEHMARAVIMSTNHHISWLRRLFDDASQATAEYAAESTVAVRQKHARESNVLVPEETARSYLLSMESQQTAVLHAYAQWEASTMSLFSQFEEVCYMTLYDMSYRSRIALMRWAEGATRKRIVTTEASGFNRLRTMHNKIREMLHTELIPAFNEAQTHKEVTVVQASWRSVLSVHVTTLPTTEDNARNHLDADERRHRLLLAKSFSLERHRVELLMQHRIILSTAPMWMQCRVQELRELWTEEQTTRQRLLELEAESRNRLQQIIGTLASCWLQLYQQAERSYEASYRAACQSVESLVTVVSSAHPTELRNKVLYLIEDSDLCHDIDFSWYDGRTRCSDETMELLVTLLKDNHYVDRLVLSNNRFAPTRAEGVLSNRCFPILGLQLLSRLSILELRNCGLVDSDVHPVLTRYLLEPHCQLTTLNLDDNNFTAPFCKDMYGLLRESSSLTCLTLTGNPLISKGMLQVLSYYCQLNRYPDELKADILALEANDPSMRTWRSRNPAVPLDDEVVKLVAVALFQNTHVLNLSFAGHRGVTDAACPSIASMLRGNASLTSLDISGTSVGDAGLQQLEYVLKSQSYRQPVLYTNLFCAPPSQMARRRSSRRLSSFRRESISPQHETVLADIQGQGFSLSIHHTNITDGKYLECVLAMNQLERSWMEVDEDEAHEMLMLTLFHTKELLEEYEECYREMNDAFESVEVRQWMHFLSTVFSPAEVRTRRVIESDDTRTRLIMQRGVDAVLVLETCFADFVHQATSLFQTTVQVMTTRWKIQSWQPGTKEMAELDECIRRPESIARDSVDRLYTDLTRLLFERYHKFVRGADAYREKCFRAKETLLERYVGASSANRKQSVMSLSQLRPSDEIMDTSFIPQQLDPKQHQALAHLANQPWELQGKGLAIAQNDPAVTTVDVSHAGVANPEEPSCTQDTIAIIFTLAKSNTHLQEINLAGNKGAITAKCAPLLSKLIVKLRVLNIADCAISEEQVLPHILGALAQPTCQLETLILDGNDISPQGATQLCRMLRVNTSLSVVSLSRNASVIPKVSLDFISFYTEVNKLPKRYRTLIRRLEANDMSCTEADFTYAPGVKIPLGLRGHTMDVSSSAGCESDEDAVTPYRANQGSLAFANSASQGTPSQVIESPMRETVPEAPLDDAAMKLICIAMTRNMIVERLLLGGNHIGDRGVKFLSIVLQNSPSLRHVDLSYNTFTDVGAQLLLRVAEGNTKLQDIRITANEGAVNVQARRMLLAQLQKNKSL